MLTEAHNVSQHKSPACFYCLRSSFPIQPFCCLADPAAFRGGPVINITCFPAQASSLLLLSAQQLPDPALLLLGRHCSFQRWPRAGLHCGMAGTPGRRKASLPATPALMGDAFELLPGLFILPAPRPRARSVHRACTETLYERSSLSSSLGQRSRDLINIAIRDLPAESWDIITCLAALGCSCLDFTLNVSCLDDAALRHLILADGADCGSLLDTWLGGAHLAVLWQMTPHFPHCLLVPATCKQQRLHQVLWSAAGAAIQQSSFVMQKHAIVPGLSLLHTAAM